MTFDVSATDNVGVVGDVTCNVESGSAITLQNGSSRTVTCSATDAEGNVGYGTFGIYTDDRFDFTLPSECADDFRQWSGGNEIPMTAIVSGSDVTSSITMDWAGLGDVTSKFVYQKNGQTVKVVDVPAPTSNSPTFVDVSSLSQGEYTVFSCLYNNYTGTMSGGDGGTWNNEPVTRFAESQTFTILSQAVAEPPTPTPVAPTPVAPTPVAPTPVAPTPVTPTPVTPTPVTPTPVTPTPVAPNTTPVPTTPGIVNANQLPQSEITISTVTGSAAPGCELTRQCYTPQTSSVLVDGVVIMSNPDTGSIHTFTIWQSL